MEQSQFFFCETDSLIDMLDLSRHGIKMKNSRFWTEQIASSFREIRRIVPESHFQKLIFATLEALTVALSESASFLGSHRFGYQRRTEISEKLAASIFRF
jgi:thermostable 8-oxoguanine DNA glycosylase